MFSWKRDRRRSLVNPEDVAWDRTQLAVRLVVILWGLVCSAAICRGLGYW